MITALYAMTDTFSPSKRSSVMSRIGSKNTMPELAVKKILNNLQFKYRLHVKDLPGRPDLANKKEKTAFFVNGCFWHQHKNCKRSSVPKSNISYWLPKLERNIQKQKADVLALRKLGWKVIVLWECQVKNKLALERKIKRKLWPN